jgi:hypothetical protein
LAGNANGTFQTPAKITPVGGKNPVFMGSDDFNHDGKADLIVANNGELLTNGTDPGSVKVLLGNGDGTITASDGHIKGMTTLNAHTTAAALFALNSADVDSFFAADVLRGKVRWRHRLLG